jgi:hypothetical protein
MSMRSERLAPLAAFASAWCTLLCCVPLTFAGAFGLASLSGWAIEYRAWLVGLSIVLLGVGFVQVYRRPATCAPRSRFSVAMVWLSAGFVAVAFLLPQLVATVMANLLG